MWKSLSINTNMSFDTRDFLSRILSFFFCCVSIFNTLCVYDQECCVLVLTIVLSLLSNQFFLTPLREVFSDSLHFWWTSKQRNSSTQVPTEGNHEASFSSDILLWVHRVLHWIYSKVLLCEEQYDDELIQEVDEYEQIEILWYQKDMFS